jgi:hypothetical protein
MVMPGVTIRKASEKRASWRLAILFSACQVQRLPGDQHDHDNRLATASSHLEGHAIEQRIGLRIGAAQLIGDPVVAVFVRHFGDVDSSLQSLDLAEEELALALRVLPVFEQTASGSGYPHVAAFAPELHPTPHAVDELVGSDAVLSPRIKG